MILKLTLFNSIFMSGRNMLSPLSNHTISIKPSCICYNFNTFMLLINAWNMEHQAIFCV